MKHAILLELLATLAAKPGPLTVIDTHAGAGLYDLDGDMARKSAEAQAGIVRLMAANDAPPEFDELKAVVKALNDSHDVRLYPGSPLLTAASIRPGDVYRGHELREDDRRDLEVVLAQEARKEIDARVVPGDGYAALNGVAANDRTLILIDPPFERGDEYDRIVEGVGVALRRNPAAVIAVWTPLKDLETFDALLRRVEALRPPSVVAAEVRLRPLTDPMKMNGCAMLIVGAPQIEGTARTICDWTAQHCGSVPPSARAEGRVRLL